MQLLKKMSAKTLLKDVLGQFPVDEATMQPKLGDSMDLFRVIGLAHTTKTGESNFGPWTSFKGVFEATVLTTGEIYRSNELFLPDVAKDALFPAVSKNIEDDGHGVQFAMLIGATVVADRTNAKIAKYEYTCRPLVDAANNDPLDAFKKSLPALPAPAVKVEVASTPKAAESAPAQAPAPEVKETKAAKK